MRPQPDPNVVMPGWLRDIAPFSALGAEELIVAAGYTRRILFRDGESLLQLGSDSADEFFLITGSVILIDRDGVEKTIVSATADAAVALASARPSLYRVEARGQVVCAVMPRAQVQLLRERSLRDDETEVAELEGTLSQTQDLWLGLKSDIAADRLRLPSQPELAVQLRDAVARANCDNRRIAALIELDPAIAAKVLRIANSPLCRGREAVTSLADAVSRIGMHTVSELVICFSLKDLFRCSSPSVRKLFAVRVGEAVRVGACASVIGNRFAPALADRALIAGLLSNIGAFPVLERLAEREELIGQQQELEALTEEVTARVGELICKRWGLGDDIVRAVCQAPDWGHTADGEITLVEIVVCARFHAWLGLGREYTQRMPHPERVPALRVLGQQREPADSLAIVREAKSRVDALLGALS